MNESTNQRRISRRQILGSLAAGAAGTGIDAQLALAEAPVTALAAADQPAGICVLTPQAVEGPYYFDPKLVRADITDGRPGAAVQLILRIVETGSCAPLANARVDVWHADAGGVYSGYTRQGDSGDVSTKGQTYLRGTQMTDGTGSVTFRTIYPGWYPGRTPHIHVKVLLDTKSMLTGQIYFPDELSGRIYRERQPYATRPVADTTNATDGIFKSGEREGGGIVLAIKEEPQLLVASLVIGVDRSGAAARTGGSWWRRMFGGE